MANEGSSSSADISEVPEQGVNQQLLDNHPDTKLLTEIGAAKLKETPLLDQDVVTAIQILSGRERSTCKSRRKKAISERREIDGTSTPIAISPSCREGSVHTATLGTARTPLIDEDEKRRQLAIAFEQVLDEVSAKTAQEASERELGMKLYPVPPPKKKMPRGLPKDLQKYNEKMVDPEMYYASGLHGSLDKIVLKALKEPVKTRSDSSDVSSRKHTPVLARSPSLANRRVSTERFYTRRGSPAQVELETARMESKSNLELRYDYTSKVDDNSAQQSQPLIAEVEEQYNAAPGSSNYYLAEQAPRSPARASVKRSSSDIAYSDQRSAREAEDISKPYLLTGVEMKSPTPSDDERHIFTARSPKLSQMVTKDDVVDNPISTELLTGLEEIMHQAASPRTPQIEETDNVPLQAAVHQSERGAESVPPDVSACAVASTPKSTPKISSKAKASKPPPLSPRSPSQHVVPSSRQEASSHKSKKLVHEVEKKPSRVDRHTKKTAQKQFKVVEETRTEFLPSSFAIKEKLPTPKPYLMVINTKPKREVPPSVGQLGAPSIPQDTRTQKNRQVPDAEKTRRSSKVDQQHKMTAQEKLNSTKVMKEAVKATVQSAFAVKGAKPAGKDQPKTADTKSKHEGKSSSGQQKVIDKRQDTVSRKSKKSREAIKPSSKIDHQKKATRELLKSKKIRDETRVERFPSAFAVQERVPTPKVYLMPLRTKSKRDVPIKASQQEVPKQEVLAHKRSTTPRKSEEKERPSTAGSHRVRERLHTTTTQASEETGVEIESATLNAGRRPPPTPKTRSKAQKSEWSHEQPISADQQQQMADIPDPTSAQDKFEEISDTQALVNANLLRAPKQEDSTQSSQPINEKEQDYCAPNTGPEQPLQTSEDAGRASEEGEESNALQNEVAAGSEQVEQACQEVLNYTGQLASTNVEPEILELENLATAKSPGTNDEGMIQRIISITADFEKAVGETVAEAVEQVMDPSEKPVQLEDIPRISNEKQIEPELGTSTGYEKQFGTDFPETPRPTSDRRTEAPVVTPTPINLQQLMEQTMTESLQSISNKKNQQGHKRTVSSTPLKTAESDLEPNLSTASDYQETLPPPEPPRDMLQSSQANEDVNTAVAKSPEAKPAEYSLARIFPTLFGHSAPVEEMRSSSSVAGQNALPPPPPSSLPSIPHPFTIPAKPSNPRRDVTQFRSDYANNFAIGSHHTVDFYSGSYEDAQRKARNEIRLIVVFIHDPTSDESMKLIDQTLNSLEFHELVSKHNLLVWGVANDSEEGKFDGNRRVQDAACVECTPVDIKQINTCNVVVFPVPETIRLLAYNLHVTKYPFISLMCPRSDNRFFSVRRIVGFTTPTDLVARLEKSIELVRVDLKDLREQRDKVLEDRRLMQQQEKEYKESAERDKQKMLEAKKAKQEKLEAEIREKQKQQELEQRKKVIADQREQLRVELNEQPADGKGVVKVQVRFPSGQKFSRTFNLDDSMEKLFAAILCHEACPDFFTVATGFPRTDIPCVPEWYHTVLSEQLIADGFKPLEFKPAKSFRAAGFSKAVGVFVNSYG